MGFLLDTDDAAPPSWPHVVCAGGAGNVGRGWAWHDDEARRRCYTGEIAASAALVAAAIDGRELAGVDRLLAIAQLREESPAGILRLFRTECPACGADHWERAQRALRVVPFVHPGAIPILRAARVPEWLLCEPRKQRPGEPQRPPSVKRKRPPLKSLPVWIGDSGRTRLAQIAFARQYALEKGAPLMNLDRPVSPPLVPWTPPAPPAPAPPVPWTPPAPTSPCGPCK